MPPAAKKTRTDAVRNRDAILRAARAAFATTDGTVALERVARDAGVGIGTLYRHFPTREALVEAVYAAEIDDLAADAPALLTELAPDAALRTWLERYAAFVATKRGMADTLRAGWTSGRLATPDTRERLTGAVAAILRHGGDTGALRTDVDAEDVVVMVLGIFLVSTAEPGTGRTARLVDLVVDALRPAPTSPA